MTSGVHSASYQDDVNEEYALTVEADGTQTFTCRVCDKSFNQRKYVHQHHRQVHLKLRPKLRGCHLCDVKVPTHQRTYHMEEVHGLPAPSCGACGKRFAFPWLVLRHQKFHHMGESKYRCEPCNLTFIGRSKYMHHQTKHADVKAFKCAICDKEFKWRSGLKTHMLIHNNIRRHVCKICQDAFVQQSSLKYHVLKKHPEMV
ncbi:jg5977 [Pararge aegeria aegeria]|uniref:Jg5977 protein n=1 Tax=Pararge aegeria aegeria TaxID=348720 RepID=A0A8S4SE92_9NEOP|nr:jg5977 [Pararge aegeria aegeria]